MAMYGYPALYALFVWWFSTALIIWLDNLPRHTFRWSMLGGTLVFMVALHRVAATAGDSSVTGAYAAFTYGVLLWGWQEMSFFMGFVTGPRTTPCPPDCVGWRRFRLATATCIYHELASLASAVAVVALTWGAANQVATWTFMVLWVMRLSSKLNVYLGVLNLNEDFVPAHLRYLCGYMRQKPINALFPFSVTGATLVLGWLALRAAAPGVDRFHAAGLTFCATMLALGIIEHWFLVLPLPFAELWSWVLRRRDGAAAARPFRVASRLPVAAASRAARGVPS
jgi:putative photosynthetic complex assembly protein 2